MNGNTLPKKLDSLKSDNYEIDIKVETNQDHSKSQNTKLKVNIKIVLFFYRTTVTMRK